MLSKAPFCLDDLGYLFLGGRVGVNVLLMYNKFSTSSSDLHYLVDM